MGKKTFAQILEDNKRESEKRIVSKIPSWKGLDVPTSLAFEQCSSEETAAYKARLIPANARIADLTGGLGVDTCAFASKSAKVWYNERNAELAASATSNFKKLGHSNIEVHTFDINPTSSEWLESLKAFAPDIIFADPARRDSAGKKVFLLEDCSPDILKLMPELGALAGTLLFKLSPMADISMLRNRLLHLAELHIISSKGECKELLCVCTPADAPFRLIVSDSESSIEFLAEEKPFISSGSELSVGDIVFEPTPALMKAARHEEFCLRYGLELFDSVTHLYFTDDSSLEVPFCKKFVVEEILPFCKSSFGTLKQKYPRAEVTARGIPMTSAELAARIGCRTGSDIHIFACVRASNRMILVCRRLDQLKEKKSGNSLS